MTLGSLVLLSLNFSIFKWNPYLLCQLGFHITLRKKQKSRQMITEMERFIFLWRRSLVVGSLGYTATQGYLQENRLLVIFMLHLIFVFDIHPHGYKTAASCLSRVSIFQEAGVEKGRTLAFFVKSLSILLAKENFPLKLQWTDLGHMVTPSCKKKKSVRRWIFMCVLLCLYVCF